MHPRYVAQVLKDRGVPAPEVRHIEAYLRSLDLPAHGETQESIRRIAQGVEAPEEIAALLQAINSAVPATLAPAQRPALASVERTHPAKPPEERSAQTTALLRAHGTHVYARGAALKIELDTLRGAEGGAPHYTLLVEGALMREGRYAWDRKIPFQMTARELPVLAAFLLGYAGGKVIFSNHGPNTDKRLEIEDQGSKLFVKLAYAGQPPIPVPVEAADVFAWGELCMVALRLNRPMLDAEALLALLRRVGKMADS